MNIDGEEKKLILKGSSLKVVSILIRTKNRIALLLDALRSVLAQEYSTIEIVIVNDGGDDVEPSLISFFKGRSIQWKLISFPESVGRSSAANKAMEVASGDYFLFLDDDDLLCNDHLLNLVLELEKNQNLIGAYSATQCVKSSISGVVNVDEVYAEDFDRIRLGYENYFPVHSVLFKRKVYDSGCRFEQSLDLYEDWHFWLQVVKFGDLKFVNKLTALYRIDTSGVGRPGQNIDLNDKWYEFVEKARSFWSLDQIAHLVFSAKELKRCQRLLDEANQNNDSLERSRGVLKGHYDSLNEINNELERKYRLLDEDYKLIVSEKDRLVEAERLLVGDYERLKESLDVVEKERNRLAEAQSVFVSHSILLDNNLEELRNKNQLIEAENVRLLASNTELLTELDIVKSSRSFRIAARLVRVAVKFRKPFIHLSKVVKMVPYAKSALPKYIKEFFRLVFAGELQLALKKTKRKINAFLVSKKVSKGTSVKYLNGRVSILATKHTLYVAELVERSLFRLGFNDVAILSPDEKVFGNELHIVVCPQMFEKLPGLYISFQMEQSVSSRWFNKRYFKILEHSLAIMDYSQANIRYLQEVGGLHYKQIFWTPISNISNFKKDIVSVEDRPYEVAFYGDPNAERRQEFIERLRERFSVLVISEVFGEELYQALSKARVVVNIHYYEGALLETTRIYECLSLGLNIVSEESSDMAEHSMLADFVRFTPIGNIEAMCDAVQEVLSSSGDNRTIPEDNENFHYYFSRMLMAVNVISRDKLNEFPACMSAKDLEKRIVLTLPETYDRHEDAKKRLPGSVFFSGLRHFDGWVGAALSYKFLAQRAVSEGLQNLEIAEDDVSLPRDFETKYSAVKQFLFNQLGIENWDVFCGLIADVHDSANILAVYDCQGIRYIQLDMMTSMVFNIYNKKAVQLLSEWDSSNADVETNTIDRYLENKSLRVVTSLPFLVGHLPEHVSSIWHFENSTYDDLIKASTKKLTKKVEDFLAHNEIIYL